MKSFINLVIIFFSLSSISFAESIHSSVTALAVQKELHNSPQWLGLLHVENGQSHVTSTSFFLDPQGQTDPKAELIATIDALLKQIPKSDNNNDSYQCLFPARTLWLKQQLGDSLDLPEVTCSQLSNWREMNNVDSISLMFVSGYLGNPASFFGHVLVKLNEGDSTQRKHNTLLDSSVNYGASVGKDDGPIKYVFFGIFGGYDAEYTMDDFFVYDTAYAELEGRELWEYELNLTDFDVELLELHLWELRKKTFNYYFLNRNCATQLSNLIAIATGVSLTTDNQPWDMPIDLFKNLAEINYNGAPLIRKTVKRESKFSRLHTKYVDLSINEKLAAKLLSQSTDNLSNDIYLSLTKKSKARVLSLLYDFYEIKLKDSDNKNELYEIKRQLLSENLTLPAFKLAWSEKKTAPPHEAQSPKMLGVSYGQNSELNSFAEINFRIGYYDYLSLESSRYRDSNATFLDTDIRLENGKARLNKFELLNISTLNILDVDLFDGQEFSWKMKLGWEQQDLSCDSCLRSRFYGGVGLAKRAFDDISLYIIPTLMVDMDYSKDSYIASDFGVLYTSNKWWKTHLIITPIILKDSANKTDVKLKWDTKFGNSPDWDLRFSLEYNVETEGKLSYLRYF